MRKISTTTTIIWALVMLGIVNIFLMKRQSPFNEDEQGSKSNKLKFKSTLTPLKVQPITIKQDSSERNSKGVYRGSVDEVTHSSLKDNNSETSPRFSHHEDEMLDKFKELPMVEEISTKSKANTTHYDHPAEDIDDIIDPMIRRADGGMLKDVVNVICNTTKGVLKIEVFPESWGSLGAHRFLDLVDAGLFSTMVALHRAVKGFIIQFGTSGDPAWSALNKGKFPSIKDDPQWMPHGPSCGAKVKLHQNTCKRHRKGFLSFAGGGSNSRRIEMYVSLKDTGHGGPPHEVPFGRVLPESFPVMDQLYTGYGEMKNFGGKAPPSGRIAREGIAFLKEEYPLLDFITGCSRV